MTEIRGLGEAKVALDALVARLDVAARQLVVEAAGLVEAAAKANFAGTHRRGQPHVGGTQPNVVTGTLRRSITHMPVSRVGLGTWATTVGPTAVYGRRVELGWNGSRGYPYFIPAATKVQPQLSALAAKRWADVVKGT